MTYRLAVLGDPVLHSRSPAVHRAALAALGLPGSYEARQVDEDGVKMAFADLRRGHLTGFNVTMPHKRLAATLCDRLDDGAARARSVNTVLLDGDEVVGHSTDIDGIRDAWNGLPGKSPALILGSGGAAAAAAIALHDRLLYISSRRFGRGQEMARDLGIEVGEVPWAVPVVGAVIVNCTPLGMKGEPLPEQVLELAAGLFDMAYGPRPTPAVATMLTLARPLVEGLELLVVQAARSFTLWTGHPAPLKEMRAAAGKR